VGCSCKTKGECNCCTPRKSAPRSRKKEASPPTRPPTADDPPPNPGSEFPALDHKQSSHVLSRIAELRPVLPKPARRTGDVFMDGPLHDPSSSGLGSNRHHVHELYSPYGRAYDNTHPNGHSNAYHQQSHQLQLDIPNYTSAPSLPHDVRDSEYLPTQNFNFVAAGQSSHSPDPGSAPAVNDAWNTFQQYGVLCGCGDACACPNCFTHRGANNPVTTPNNTPTNSPSHVPRSSCVNPDACGACIECLMFPSTFSFSATPNADGVNDTGNNDGSVSDIDQWLASLPQTALDSFMAGPVPVFQLPPASELDDRIRSRRESPGCQCPPGLCECNNCDGGCQPPTFPARRLDEQRPPFSAAFGNDYPSNGPIYAEYNPQMDQLRMDMGPSSSQWEAVDTDNDFEFWNSSTQTIDPMMAMKRTRSASSSSEASSRFSADQPVSVFSDGQASGHSSQESLHGRRGMGFNQSVGLPEYY